MRYIVLPLLLVLVKNAACEDIFRGGTLSWQPFTINQVRNEYAVLFKYKMAWKLGHGPCGKSCDHTNVNALGNVADFQSFICVQGCGQRNLKISDANYIVSSINGREDWEQGQKQFHYVFNSPGPFTIAFEGSSWIQLARDSARHAPWRMQTVVNLFPRSDTGRPNNSPTAGFLSVHKEFINCALDIQIPVADKDGDIVRCRWADTEEECGGVCRGLPGVVLDKDKCTIHPYPIAIASHGLGYYPATVVVEDFPVTEVTVNGVTYDSSRPFSQIPTQFTVFITPQRLQSCDRPQFFNTSLIDGQLISIRPDNAFVEIVCARGTGGSIVTEYIVTAPQGMNIEYSNFMEIDSMCMTMKWTPSRHDVGSHFLCYTAEQMSGVSSPTVCVTLRVDETDACGSSPCPPDQLCVDVYDKYTCRSRNETHVETKPGEITTASCLADTVDLAFVLDSSNSLLASDIAEMKAFVRDVIVMFGVGEDSTNVGLILYDDSVHLKFNLKDYKSTAEVLEAVNNITFGTGGTDTGEALKYMYDTMFTRENGDRLLVPNVAVVLTDGHSKDLYATQYYAKLAREKGITLFVLGIGPQINMAELKNIANQPSDQFAFVVRNFSELHTVAKMLEEMPCSVKLPNSTYLTTMTPRTGCYNALDNCRLYGEDACTDYPGWSADNCALWCGVCNGSATSPKPCVDMKTNCVEYGHVVCEKPSFRWWAEDNCRAFCGFCPGVSKTTTQSTTTALPVSTTPKVCTDLLDNCHSYPKESSCNGEYEGWARHNCPVYCGYCPPDYREIPESLVGNVICPAWKLPIECAMRETTGDCCPVPQCPDGYKLTAERVHH